MANNILKLKFKINMSNISVRIVVILVGFAFALVVNEVIVHFADQDTDYIESVNGRSGQYIRRGYVDSVEIDTAKNQIIVYRGDTVEAFTIMGKALMDLGIDSIAITGSEMSYYTDSLSKSKK